MPMIIKLTVVFVFLGQGSAGILPNEDQKQSPMGNEVIIGDMILTQEQYDLLYGEGTRSGVPEAWNGRWPNKQLPYEIDSSVISSDIAIIESTISRFNSEMSGCFSIV